MGSYKGILGGIDTMVASRFTPWHYEANKDRVNLTEHVIKSGRQALTMARMDWEVEVVNLNDIYPADGAEDYAIVRRMDTGAVVGQGSAGYTVIQNAASADMCDAIITAVPDSCIEAAGTLYVPGKVTWMLVRLPDNHVYFGTDNAEHHERYVLVSNSHDGSQSFTIRPTDVRVQCMNTISMAWAGTKAEYTIRHTTNANDYVEQARIGMSLVVSNWEAQNETIKNLLDTELDEMDFVMDVVPKVIERTTKQGPKVRPEEPGKSQDTYDEKFAAIVSMYNADHNEAIKDTAWGAVNAFNEFEEWAVKPRKYDQADRQMGMLLRGDYPMTKCALALVS